MDNEEILNLQNETTGKKQVKVLLAEDNSDDKELFTDAIEQSAADVEVKTVDNGQQLVDVLKDPDEPNPDIIFADINMPYKNGIEAVAEIKADEELKDIPVVMLSTSDNPRSIEKSYQAGADIYMQKPNSFTNFVILLRKILSFHWAGQLLRSAWDRFFVSESEIPKKKL